MYRDWFPYHNNILILCLLGAVMLLLILILVFIFYQKKLKKAVEAAETASRIKTSFLANMSHEIRTPMNAILGMTELLLEDKLTERQKSYVNDINISAHSLLEIINDILDMSKIETGNLELSAINYDFHAFLNNINAMFTYVAEKKKIEFMLEKVGELPHYLYGDDIRLKQIITNICGNAVKFTDKGSVCLKVAAIDEMLVFKITDTGRGIRKEEIGHLFTAFRQSDTTKNRGIIGTGLGLSISKSFTEMMGGKITVVSEYGKGSAFVIMIPLVLGKEVSTINKVDRHFLFAPEAKILIVDDNQINLNVGIGLLNLMKIKADTANSGVEAIKMIGYNEYDIVFMDHMMPDMDGIETTAGLRELGYTDLPIIALTANAIRGAKEMFLDNGFNDFLTKPINRQDLIDILIEWLPADKLNHEGEIEINESEDGESAFLDAVRKIAEINVKIGMKHVLNREQIYHNTVKAVYTQLPSDCHQMALSLDKGDIRNFVIMVHGLKSVLATIGATELPVLALELEMAGRADDVEYLKDSFPEFRNRLLQLHECLTVVFVAE